MSKVEILKFDDLLKYHNPNGTLKNGIDKVYFTQTHSFIFVKAKEEYIKKLKACGFNVIDIVGLYFEKWMCGTHCIYFRKEEVRNCDSNKDIIRRTIKV